jgi:hypothetical protein
LQLGFSRAFISILCCSVPCCAVLCCADRHLCARIVYGLLTDALKFDGSNQRWATCVCHLLLVQSSQSSVHTPLVPLAVTVVTCVRSD